MRTDTNRPPCDPIPLPAFDADWEKGVPYTFGPLTLVIEYLGGETRAKVITGGVQIKNVFPCPYGRILGTTDIHGEEIDFYLASMAKADADVFVIDQIDPATGLFDEHKVMLGFGSIHEVVHNYETVFSDGSARSRIGFITEFSPESFAQWVGTEGFALKPSSQSNITGVVGHKAQGIAPFPRPIQTMIKPRDELGGVIVELTDLSKGPKIKTTTPGDNIFHYHLYFYCGLDHKVWSNPIDVFCRMLNQATEADTAHIHIASPGGSVILMGRLISAINRTKAKVITYAEGVVASAATAIWCAGHERHIRAGAYFMQHMSSQLLAGKTTDIKAKAEFCVDYIEERLQRMAATGLFTQEEVRDMVDKSSDVYVSGRDAISRMGEVSTRANG